MERTGTVHSQPSKPCAETELSFSLSFSCFSENEAFLFSALCSPQSCLTRSLPADRLAFQCKVGMETMPCVLGGWWGSGPIPDQAALNCKWVIVLAGLSVSIDNLVYVMQDLFLLVCMYIYISIDGKGSPGLIAGSGRSPGEGNGYQLQSSCLEIPKDRGVWQAYSPWSGKQSDRMEQLTLSLLYMFVDVHTHIHTTNMSSRKVI